MRRNRISYLLSILLFVCLFTGCSSKKEETVDNSLKIDYVNHEKYEKITFIDDNHLTSPNGIVCDGSSIYIVDKTNNCICIYDYDGNFIKKIGTSGNGELEFMKPVSIALNKADGTLYVADESTGRIQVIRQETYIKDFYIEEVKNNVDATILGIEVDGDHNLYASITGFDARQLKIYTFDMKGNRNKIGEKQIGVLGKGKGNEILFAQTYELSDGSFGSGKSYFSKIHNKELLELSNLPNDYTPSSIFYQDNGIYIFSNGMCQLDRFDYDGKYKETIYEEEATIRNRGMFFVTPFEDSSVLITDRENGVVYRIMPKGE